MVQAAEVSSSMTGTDQSRGPGPATYCFLIRKAPLLQGAQLRMRGYSRSRWQNGCHCGLAGRRPLRRLFVCAYGSRVLLSHRWSVAHTLLWEIRLKGRLAYRAK
jgi:hypothetical protein